MPEERLGRGAVPAPELGAKHVAHKASKPLPASGWIQTQTLQAQAQKIIDQFNVKANGTQAAAQSLSGGNLQKFIVGREIDAKPKVLLVSQPTWGVDVGAPLHKFGVRCWPCVMPDVRCWWSAKN